MLAYTLPDEEGHSRLLNAFSSKEEAVAAQRESLPADLRPAYCGIADDGQPLFQLARLPLEVQDKYKHVGWEA